MTDLLAIAGGSVDPGPLICGCCAEPLLLIAVVTAIYGLARNSARPIVLAGLAVGGVGVLVLTAYVLPDPSPVVVIGGNEVIDPDVEDDTESFHAARRHTLGWWGPSAAVVVGSAAVLFARRHLGRNRAAGPPAPPSGPVSE